MSLYPQLPETTPFSSLLAAAKTTAAAMTPVVAGVAGKVTYLTGFEVGGGGASAGLPVPVTFSGLVVSPQYFVQATAGATIAGTPLRVTFPQPIPAATMGTTVGITVASFGSGNVLAYVNLYGFIA